MQADAGQIASFREIHKNAWLKRIPPAGPKKASTERWWTVFCVHGDAEPFLEGYAEPGGAALAHSPRWRTPLARALHVSGSVGPAGPRAEYEFVVALQEGVVRLIAPTWESMQDWVDTLRSKLREMKIISPKENVYSKGPEQCKPRAPTRDPTSPLPPPPPGPTARVPGTEPSARVAAGARPPSGGSVDRSPPPEVDADPPSPAFPRVDAPAADGEPRTESAGGAPRPSGAVSDGRAESPPSGATVETSEDGEPSAARLRRVDSDDGDRRRSPERDRDESAVRDSDFVSNLANVSGMSICLVDSVLDHRMKNEANADFFADFDLYDCRPSASNVETRVIEKDAVGAKYSQVDLSKKSNFISNKSNIQELSQPGSSSAGVDGGIQNIQKCSIDHLIKKCKPQVAPRTTICNDSTIGAISINDHTGNENIREAMNITNLKIKLQLPPNSNQREKPVVAERKKNLQVNPHLKSEETDSDREISNVTIITVSNDLNNEENKSETLNGNRNVENPSKKFPRIANEVLNCSENDYVNFSIDVDTNFIKKNKVHEIGNVNQSTANNRASVPVRVNSKIIPQDINLDSKRSAGSGYGHIQHSTTVGVKSENNQYENSPFFSKGSHVKCIELNLPSTSACQSFPPVVQNSRVVNENRFYVSDDASISEKRDKISKGPQETRQTSFDVFINPGDQGVPKQESENGIWTVKVLSPCDAKSQSRGTVESEDFYESVFTPFTVAKGSSCSFDNISQQPSSSNFYIRNDKNLPRVQSDSQSPNTTNNTHKPSEYEFLSWNEAKSVKLSQNALQVKPPSVNRTSQQTNLELDRRNNLPESDSNENRITNLPDGRNLPSQNEDTLVNKIEHSDKQITNSKNNKHGLFTRGLTELSIMSRFRNISHPNSSRSPLLKNSQFYSYEDMNPQCSTSPNENTKRNSPFAEKLNNIFSKMNEDRNNITKEKVSPKTLDSGILLKSESPLKRNWSEHNDRTVLPVVKNVNISRVRRSRASPNENVSQQSTDANVIREEIQIRRRSSSLSDRRSNIGDSSFAPDTIITSLTNINKDAGNAPFLLRPMGLREQQVARLRGEMAHAGGVRLRLRSGDCLSEAMALADAYGTVWVCGWKQRTHPLLYNALHIGDRLATVGGVPITSVRQAKRALKDTSSGLQHVELVIKRLPHGRVYALKKDSDDQDLGLTTDSATVTGVIPGSPAARGGVLPNGTLTEVNGRPLNLLVKKGDTQVRDRLNAIGRDVSILIQPTEFVALLRASLRNIRGHKDYIVQ